MKRKRPLFGKKKNGLSARLHTFLFPHKKNAYKPGIFSIGSVMAIAVVLCAAQVGYFYAASHGGAPGSAAVLPGVLTNLTNNDRSLNNVSSLTPDALLTKAANAKAADMAANGYFAHVSPTGKTPWFWLDGVGYKYTYAGENLAINFTDSTDVENAWMHSPAHRANIVKAQYTRIGIGVAEGTYQGKPAIFVAQFFATPTSSFSKTLTSGTAVAVAATTSKSVGKTNVLGAEIETPEASMQVQKAITVFEAVATSPHHLLIYTIGALILIVLILLLIAIAIPLGVQYVEVIGGGLVLLLVLIGFLIFNVRLAPSGSVPENAQPAAAFEAF